MKTGVHPMKVHLKLFFKWGIEFDDEHPYTVPENGNRKVQYAEKKEIQDGIMEKYHPESIFDEPVISDKVNGGSQTQVQQPVKNPPKRDIGRRNTNGKKGGSGQNLLPKNVVEVSNDKPS